ISSRLLAQAFARLEGHTATLFYSSAAGAPSENFTLLLPRTRELWRAATDRCGFDARAEFIHCPSGTICHHRVSGRVRPPARSVMALVLVLGLFLALTGFLICTSLHLTE